MQAVIAKGRGFENLKVAQIPVPKITADQCLGRVDAAGVCTSILKLIDQGPDHTFIRGWDMETYPVILGDEDGVYIRDLYPEPLNKWPDPPVSNQ